MNTLRKVMRGLLIALSVGVLFGVLVLGLWRAST